MPLILLNLEIENAEKPRVPEFYEYSNSQQKRMQIRKTLENEKQQSLKGEFRIYRLPDLKQELDT